MGRLALIIAALSLLGACNVVMTKTPLFTKADAAGAPKLRPGVWENDVDAGCQLDESKPLAEWPDCANAFVVIDDFTLGGFSSHDGKPVWSTTDAVVAAGDPLVFQVHATGAPDASADAPPIDGYLYAGVEPTKRDDQGRVIATVSWPVLCGPPPPDGTKSANGAPRMGTLKPLPGMTMDADGNDCSTTSPANLRDAAKASRQWTGAASLSNAHWVRDGDH